MLACASELIRPNCISLMNAFWQNWGAHVDPSPPCSDHPVCWPPLEISRRLRSCDTPLAYCTNLLPELTLPTVLSVVLLLKHEIRLTMTLSLVLHLLYLSLPWRHSYSVRHLGVVGSHNRNLSVSASGVFDILALYKLLDYYVPSKRVSKRLNVESRK